MESGEEASVTGEANRFRGSGTIGAPERARETRAENEYSDRCGEPEGEAQNGAGDLLKRMGRHLFEVI